MSKGIYVGVDDIARKVTKAYAGVENKARKITKGYVGVGGVARPIYSSEKKVVYYGLGQALTKVPSAVASLGDYAVCCRFDCVEAYTPELLTTPLDLTRFYSVHDGVDFGEYALFAGMRREANGAERHSVDAYSKELTKTDCPDLLVYPNCRSGVVGDYAVFGGGVYETETGRTVQALTKELTVVSADNQSYAGIGCVASANSKYVLFGAGWYGNYIDAYDSNLVHTEVNQLIQDSAATCSLGEYALFAGGSLNNDPFSTDEVIAIDTNLVAHTCEALYMPVSHAGAVSIDEFVLVGGGYNYLSGGNIKLVNVYNRSLLRCDMQSLSAENTPKGAVAGGKALFISSVDAVPDIFTVV